MKLFIINLCTLFSLGIAYCQETIDNEIELIKLKKE